MKVLELFAGTRSIGRAFEARGGRHKVFSVEWNKDFENIDLYADILQVTAEDIIEKFGYPDVIWASPDCTTFSIAAISHHRRKNEETGNLDPISDYAKFCDEVDQHVLKLIKELKPKLYFIENPRGAMRKMTWMQPLPRYTVTYCQYGDKRMKPTDIWTNHPNPKFKPMCKNGDPCHEKAPRGSKTGTQGIKGSKDRSIIPAQLCEHIVDICEEYIQEADEMAMELKIKAPTIPEVIEFNFEELKAEIEAKANEYSTLVYTEDSIKDAKADRAKLRKFVDGLETERKKVKAECLQPYEEFEKKIKELTGIINKPIQIIDAQVKQFEDEKKAKKMEEIQDYWQECEDMGYVPDSISLMMIFDEKWMNASVSMKAVREAIDTRLQQIRADIHTLDNLPEFGFEAKQEYLRSLDLGRAIAEGQRLADIQKRKAEAEKAKAEAEKVSRQETATPEKCESVAEDPEPKSWLRFEANLTISEAYELRDFFKSRNIEFKSI